MKRISFAFAAAALALALTACSSPAPLPFEIPKPPAPTVTPSPLPVNTLVPEPGPAPEPIPEPDPVPIPHAGFTPEQAYERCTTMSAEMADGGGPTDLGPLVHKPFEDSEVIDRHDGYWWVYSDYSRTGQEDIGATQCILGGTYEDTKWILYGQQIRDLRPELDPYADLTQWSD